jgi:hypothetical protein
MISCVLAFAALLAAPADPPPADTCCLTYGQVQSIIAAVGYIPATSVSQCLIGSATHKSAFPTQENAEFRFVEDQTVGVSAEKDGKRVLCIQWKAVEKALAQRPGIVLLYDGVPHGARDLEKFHGKMKRSDVVILVMRYVKEKGVCELAQIHIIPFDKVKPQKGKDKD